jgi:hypothetical protein
MKLFKFIARVEAQINTFLQIEKYTNESWRQMAERMRANFDHVVKSSA